MVEIGNFDAFYPEGRIFGATEVLELTRCTRSLLPEVVLSVTVPHVLPMDEQEQLAIDLVAAGAAGVGVGSAVNRLNDELAMVAVVRGLREALSFSVRVGV